MADVSVKMGVSGVQQFKQSMTEAQSSVKTLDAALKLNEKQLKNAGSAEAYMSAQTSILTEKLNAQKRIVQNAQQALQQMEANGLKKTTKSYQDMQRKLIEAQIAMMDTQEQIDTLGNTASATAEKTDQLATSLGGLNKKVSLDQVISGIDRITGGMEKAAKSVINFAKTAWNEIMNLTGYADEVATGALKYGISTEEYQAMAHIAETWGETSVEAIMAARQRVQYNARSLMEEGGLLEQIGLFPEGAQLFNFGELYDWKDLFWEIGDALLHMENGADRAKYAQDIFGRSWEELMPMFVMGREEYERLIEDQKKNKIIPDEDIKALSSLNDTIIQVSQQFETLEGTVLAKLAPGLTAAAEAVGTFLGNLMEFLQTERGQELLDRMAEAISGLFDDLSNIKPESLVENLVSVFETIISNLEWLVEHKDDVINALAAIVTGWGALKLTGAALDILKLIDGLKGLRGGGNGSSDNTAVTGNGESAAGGKYSFLDKAVAGMATKTVLDTSWALMENAKTLADVTVSQEKRLENWVDAQIASGFIDPSRREEVIANNSVLFTVGNMPTEAPAPIDLSGFTQNIEIAGQWTFGDDYSTEELIRIINGEDPAVVHAEIEVVEDAAEQIAQDVGVVQIPAQLYVSFVGGAGGSRFTEYMSHANGLPYVPFDGYAALLHKGEQVIPAREASKGNFSSNLYIENMNLHNGQDADGLAARIASANRRVLAGYGS